VVKSDRVMASLLRKDDVQILSYNVEAVGAAVSKLHLHQKKSIVIAGHYEKEKKKEKKNRKPKFVIQQPHLCNCFPLWAIVWYLQPLGESDRATTAAKSKCTITEGSKSSPKKKKKKKRKKKKAITKTFFSRVPPSANSRLPYLAPT
jgi:hypothetical protein